jgi:putative phosphoesterase
VDHRREVKSTPPVTLVQLKPDGSLRVGVVADTHSAPNERGLEHLAALEPDAVLHAGDIGDLSVLERLRALAPLYAVRGNVDAHAPGLDDAMVLGFERGGQRGLTVYLTHIAVYGAVRIRSEVAKAARAANAKLIVCGHSHVPFITQQQGLTLFNPGSIGPRRPGLPILFGVIELTGTQVLMHHYDCETGKQWLPP